jgi:hypothetical protein
MKQGTEIDHLAVLHDWIAGMMVESNKELCRILIQLIDEDKITFRLDADKHPVFMVKQVKPDVEELISLIDNPVDDGILYAFLQKKLEFRPTVEKGKKNSR